MNNRKRGGIIVRVLVGLAVVCACCLALVVVTALYFAKNVRVTEWGRRGETRVETPLGTLRVQERGTLDPKSMGVPVYPGAERLDDSRKLASFELDFGDVQKDLKIAVAEYVTPDPMRKVEAFYRDRLRGARIKHGRRQRLCFELGDGSLRKIVALHQGGGRTHIALASIAHGAAN